MFKREHMNDDESLDSECEDESLSSEQLEISPESDLSECSSVSTAKPNSSSSQKEGRKAVWRESNTTFSMFELTPRLLPTFKAWLLSTRSFCFNMAKNFQPNGVNGSDNLEKLDQDHFKLRML